MVPIFYIYFFLLLIYLFLLIIKAGISQNKVHPCLRTLAACLIPGLVVTLLQPASPASSPGWNPSAFKYQNCQLFYISTAFYTCLISPLTTDLWLLRPLTQWFIWNLHLAYHYQSYILVLVNLITYCKNVSPCFLEDMCCKNLCWFMVLFKYSSLTRNIWCWLLVILSCCVMRQKLISLFLTYFSAS